MADTLKADVKSMDIQEHQINKLKGLFPEVFTEGNQIDWERLRLTLGDAVDTEKERYGMVWPGKADCYKTIQQPSIATLKPAREESLNFDTTQNLFIEGDNLEVLKLLQKSYLGKVKLIYIDPPYNTGNDFIYPDNYSENLDTYLRYTSQVDDEGRKFSTLTETDGRFHSKWMNMMYPRLFLAKNLLRDDGVIFVSIDDHEVSNLKTLLNEIFGEENHLISTIWHRRQNADNRNLTNASTDHEYVLAYRKTDVSILKGKSIDILKYKNPDNDERGPWASIDLSGLATREQRPNLHYDIVDPVTGLSYPPNPARGWSKSRETTETMIKHSEILFPSKPTGRPRQKKFLKDLHSDTTGFSSILKNVGFTTDGTRELTEIFGERSFSFPKPINLLKTLINQCATSEDTILDFFAGSATTADAVLKLNSEDNGNRKFICVQLPEPTDRDDYHTIADIGKERIRRVIKKIKTEQSEKNAKLDDVTNVDLGFKVFKLAQSTFKIWDAGMDKTPKVIQTKIEAFVDHIDPKATEEDVLYELLLKAGYPLITSIEKLTIEGKSVYSIDGESLFICLEKELSLPLFRSMSARKPARVICLDVAFGVNDALKTNAVQIMKSQDVEFRTV